MRAGVDIGLVNGCLYCCGQLIGDDVALHRHATSLFLVMFLFLMYIFSSHRILFYRVL